MEKLGEAYKKRRRRTSQPKRRVMLAVGMVMGMMLIVGLSALGGSAIGTPTAANNTTADNGPATAEKDRDDLVTVDQCSSQENQQNAVTETMKNSSPGVIENNTTITENGTEAAGDGSPNVEQHSSQVSEQLVVIEITSDNSSDIHVKQTNVQSNEQNATAKA